MAADEDVTVQPPEYLYRRQVSTCALSASVIEASGSEDEELPWDVDVDVDGGAIERMGRRIAVCVPGGTGMSASWYRARWGRPALWLYG